jgi:hypothetical protein
VINEGRSTNRLNGEAGGANSATLNSRILHRNLHIQIVSRFSRPADESFKKPVSPEIARKSQRFPH